MKKAVIALIAAIALPMMAQAQSEGLLARKKMHSAKADQTEYARPGAVPERDGKVVFAGTVAMPGCSKDDIYTRLASWASLRYEPNSTRGIYTDADFFKNIEYSAVKQADRQSGAIRCQGAEELIFSIKTLAKNYCQVFYLLDLKTSDGKVEFTLGEMSFNVDQGEARFERVAAEDWITDRECLNKKGEMRRIPAKFRIKTIDMVEELKAEIAALAND